MADVGGVISMTPLGGIDTFVIGGTEHYLATLAERAPVISGRA